jgi:MFS family permease
MTRTPSLMARLGFPETTGQGRFITANAIDSLGNGLILAFTIIYFARTTSLSLPAVGVALSAGRILATPTAIAVGPLVDRFGARATAVTGNLISLVGFVGFLFAHVVWSVVLVTWLVQVGSVTYWTSSSAMVVMAAQGGERVRWFAFIRVLRNAGAGLGGALGAVTVALGGATGLRAIVVVNALSFAAAATLLARWRPAPAAPSPETETAKTGTSGGAAGAAGAAAGAAKVGYRTVLRDARYMLLVGINVSFVFASLLNSLLLAVYITEGLHRQAWLAGVLAVMNTAQVALTQSLVSRRLERFRPMKVIAAACALDTLAFLIFASLYSVPGWAVFVGLFAAVGIRTFAEIAATPHTSNLSVAMAPEHMRGRYLGVYQLSYTLAQTLAPALLTYLLSEGPLCPWLFLMGMSVCAAPAVLLLERLGNRAEQRRGQETDSEASMNAASRVESRSR